MRTSKNPVNSWGKMLLLSILSEPQHGPGVITIEELAVRLYGEYTPETYVNTRQLIARLRRKERILEIETVTGYRLRRPNV